LYIPKQTNSLNPVLVWMHGGGYVMGKPEMDDHRCIQYVRHLGITVASIDYRYAPEHPFPTPLEDCYSALLWVESHGEQFGIDTGCIAVGGESAGGGLAAALIQLAHDRNEVKPVFQLLVCPMLDDRTCFQNDISRTILVWSLESNQFGWEAYLGTPYETGEPPAYSVPSRRKDLTGLPPAWIGVGTLDLFQDEVVRYAQNLRRCRVVCELYSVPGAFHGFDNLAPQTRVARDFKNAQIAALKAFLFPQS
jgi:acetyl esterase/lipase